MKNEELTPKGRETQARLIKAARRLMIRHQEVPELVSVAEAAGVSAGLPYRYFTSKGELLAAVIDEFYAKFLRVMSKVQGEDYHDQQRQRVVAMIDFCYRDKLTHMVLSSKIDDSAAIAALQDNRESMINYMTLSIQRGQQLGEVAASINPRIAAATMLGGLWQAIAVAMEPSTGIGRSDLESHLVAFINHTFDLPTLIINPA